MAWSIVHLLKVIFKIYLMKNAHNILRRKKKDRKAYIKRPQFYLKYKGGDIY